MAVLSCLNLYRISESSIRAKMPFSNAFVRFRGNEIFFPQWPYLALYVRKKDNQKKKWWLFALRSERILDECEACAKKNERYGRLN